MLSAIFEIYILKPPPPRAKFHASFRKCTPQSKYVTYPPHYKRLDRVGGSDGVLKEGGGGFAERLEEDPKRSVMYAELE